MFCFTAYQPFWGYLTAELSHLDKSFKQFSLVKVQFFVYTQLVKTVLFQTTQFSISTQFSSVWPMDRTLSGATSLGQSGPVSQSLTISLFSVISRTLVGGVLPLCWDAIGIFCRPSWLGYQRVNFNLQSFY